MIQISYKYITNIGQEITAIRDLSNNMSLQSTSRFTRILGFVGDKYIIHVYIKHDKYIELYILSLK